MKIVITNAKIVGEISEGLTVDGIRNMLQKAATDKDTETKKGIKDAKFMPQLNDKPKMPI